jgi:hypothetical protein
MIVVGLCIVAAITLLFIAVAVDVKNLLSTILIKFIPLLIAALLIFIAARDAGWIVRV